MKYGGEMKDHMTVYGLGFIGAAVYFIQQASSFWGGVVGVLKAFIWPALLAYHLLQFLKM
jgi:hypothetical protein